LIGKDGGAGRLNLLDGGGGAIVEVARPGEVSLQHSASNNSAGGRTRKDDIIISLRSRGGWAKPYPAGPGRPAAFELYN
jgi:hypothetical protein